MASTNQSPQYQKAEIKFLSAQTDQERLIYLEEMIRECPKHKSAEKMLAQLKTRRKKLLEKLEKAKKAGGSKSSRSGIKKEEMQAVIVGFTNTGKSSLLSALTNASPEIQSYKFTTKKPVIGIMNYNDVLIQLIEIPALGSEYYDKGIVNTADLILILVTDIEQIEKIKAELDKATGKRIVLFNIKNTEDKRKISATLSSKKHDFRIISTKTKENIEELKNKIFQSFDKIRIYTKEPGKEKSKNPLILDINSTVKEVAEKILKNPKVVLETKIWGPSAKFPGQKVNPKHQLKDLDVIEFKIK